MGVSVPGGLSLSRGVSVQGDLYLGGLCLGGSMSRGGLCPGVSVQGVSVHGGSLSWIPPCTVMSGQYASYWNTSLFHFSLLGLSTLQKH